MIFTFCAYFVNRKKITYETFILIKSIYLILRQKNVSCPTMLNWFYEVNIIFLIFYFQHIEFMLGLYVPFKPWSVSIINFISTAVVLSFTKESKTCKCFFPIFACKNKNISLPLAARKVILCFSVFSTHAKKPEWSVFDSFKFIFMQKNYAYIHIT